MQEITSPSLGTPHMELFSNLGLSGFTVIASNIFASTNAAPTVIKAVVDEVSDVDVSCIPTRPFGGRVGPLFVSKFLIILHLFNLTVE